MPSTPSYIPLSLALQGGGTHGAFTWGAVDQLLADGRIGIEAISASSGGSMIAVILAQGMAEGGSEGARALLKNFWRKVSVAAAMVPLQMNMADKFLGHVGIDLSASSMALDYITRMFSPYQFNLFDINPLRGILAEMVDFESLRRRSPFKLFINATHARTGQSRVFGQSELSLDAVMASSCLPFLFKTVEVDGEPYWDGSYSGAPPLAPLVNNTDSSDILLVQVHPAYVEDVPTSAADILDRAMEMSFHSVLLHELKTIELYNQMVEAGHIEQKPVYIHCIEAQDTLATLGRASKLNAEWDFLLYLHDLGAQAASDWLEKNISALGKKSSINIASLAA